MPIPTKKLLLGLGIAASAAMFLYLLIYISEAKLQLIVTVLAVGGGCFIVGLYQESPYSQRELERLRELIQERDERIRTLKEMYIEDKVTTRAIDPAPLPPADTITIRGGPLRDLFGKLFTGMTPVAPAVGRIPAPETTTGPVLPEAVAASPDPSWSASGRER